jgi:hypothetical protein
LKAPEKAPLKSPARLLAARLFLRKSGHAQKKNLKK